VLELTKKNVLNKVVEYRKYNKDDYESYAIFCADNFGKNAHQLNRSYLEWLYDDTSKGFEVAVCEGKIVGMEHNFKAPVLINDEHTIVTVLHDLMVDEGHRGTVGFRLMQDSLKKDDYLVLPGAVGRLSRLYGRLGSKKFESFWYRKFQFPINIFRSISERRFSNYKKLATKQNFILGHSKENDGILVLKALKKFNDVACFTSYIEWRFSNKNAPLTFYVTDESGKNTVLFIIGKRGLIPYVRVFYVDSKSESILKKIMILVEKITKKLGIPVILYSSFECPPCSGSGYKIYAKLPVSYVYSKDKMDNFVPTVPSFCSDIGFDGLNVLDDAYNEKLTQIC